MSKDNRDVVFGAGPDRLAEDMLDHTQDAASFLKAMSHEGRLKILCYLADGEKSVTELELLLGSRQAAVSQQLARLRTEGLVGARRDGKAIFYSIRDARVRRMIGLMYDLFLGRELVSPAR